MSEEEAPPQVPLDGALEIKEVPSGQQPPLPDESQRVEDVSKAWDMAHAGDEERTDAAEIRKPVRAAEEHIADPLVDRTGKDLYGYTDEQAGLIKQGLGVGDYDASKKWRVIEQEHLGKPDEWSEADQATRQEIDEHMQGEKEKAAQHDARAERLEEWAGILHDHPVSESYKRLHPDYYLDDPADLAHIEGIMRNDFAEADDLEAVLADTDTASPFVGIYREHEYKCFPLGRLMAMSDSRDQQEWRSLSADESTTLGAVKEFYTRVAKKHYVDPKRRYAEKISAMLNDIKSGRASQEAPETTE